MGRQVLPPVALECNRFCSCTNTRSLSSCRVRDLGRNATCDEWETHGCGRSCLSFPGWDFKVHSYGVMILLACFAALAIGVWRARREKIDTNVVYELATWLFLGGVVGARGVYVLSHWHTIHELWATSSGAGKEATSSTDASWAD